MNDKQLKDFITVATGRGRVVRSSPITEQDRAIAMAVVRNRADLAKMTAKQRKAAILRGSW
jgi:hypothetical protein